MKKFLTFNLLILCTTSTVVGSSTGVAKRLEGNWQMINSEQSSMSNEFSITFKFVDKKITGQYCSVTHGGKKIDCGEGDFDTPNIRVQNKIGPNEIYVNFDSFFGAKNGMSKLTLNDDRLVWEVIKEPEGGDFFGPKNASLIKSK